MGYNLRSKTKPPTGPQSTRVTIKRKSKKANQCRELAVYKPVPVPTWTQAPRFLDLTQENAEKIKALLAEIKDVKGQPLNQREASIMPTKRENLCKAQEKIQLIFRPKPNSEEKLYFQQRMPEFFKAETNSSTRVNTLKKYVAARVTSQGRGIVQWKKVGLYCNGKKLTGNKSLKQIYWRFWRNLTDPLIIEYSTNFSNLNVKLRTLLLRNAPFGWGRPQLVAIDNNAIDSSEVVFKDASSGFAPFGVKYPDTPSAQMLREQIYNHVYKKKGTIKELKKIQLGFSKVNLNEMDNPDVEGFCLIAAAMYDRQNTGVNCILPDPGTPIPYKSVRFLVKYSFIP